jgi:hypothetical protein
MGYLKGRFTSLRGIRVRVDSTDQIKIAVWWMIACMAIHAFAMDVECTQDFSVDEFFKAGLKIMEEERHDRENEPDMSMNTGTEAVRDIELLQGKLKREILKEALFSYREGMDM